MGQLLRGVLILFSKSTLSQTSHKGCLFFSTIGIYREKAKLHLEHNKESLTQPQGDIIRDIDLLDIISTHPLSLITMLGILTF